MLVKVMTELGELLLLEFVIFTKVVEWYADFEEEVLEIARTGPRSHLLVVDAVQA